MHWLVIVCCFKFVRYAKGKGLSGSSEELMLNLCRWWVSLLFGNGMLVKSFLNNNDILVKAARI